MIDPNAALPGPSHRWRRGLQPGGMALLAGLARRAPLWLPLSALVLWMASLQSVDVGHMTDVGLIAALPPQSFIALTILTASFCVTLYLRQAGTAVYLWHLALLIFMVYGVTALVEPVPRVADSWIHAGITDYIMRNGRSDPLLDARFSWPGFFALSAFMTQVAGFKSPISFATWAPVGYNLLYLGPLVMLLRALTPDDRLVWLAAWIFYLTNWVGQDYFSPQGLMYFPYLTILAMLAQWFRTPAVTLVPLPRQRGRLARLRHVVTDWSAWSAWFARGRAEARVRSGQRTRLMVIIFLLFVALVPSHQLTPVVVWAGVAALVACGQCSARTLPIFMAVVIWAWLSYMAGDFVSGHVQMLTGDAGQVSGTFNQNVTDHLAGSAGHLFVIRLRLLMTVALWGLAFLGGIRRLYQGYRDLSCAVLAIAPFPFLLFQSYGGEILLRVYFFALPFMAFFAAALFYSSHAERKRWPTTVVIGVASLVLLGSFFVTRYGNERMDSYTTAEVQAAQRLYALAKPGSLLTAISYNLPWQAQGWGRYSYYTPTPDNVRVGNVAPLLRVMSNKKYANAYLIVTRSEQIYTELFSGQSPAEWAHLERSIAVSPHLKRVFANRDAEIYVYVRTAHTAGSR